MRRLTRKRVASLAAISVATVALSAAGSGTASAACTPITAQGSSLQTLLHTSIWAPPFPCAGILTYTGNSSGAGLTAWGADGVTSPTTDAFGAADREHPQSGRRHDRPRDHPVGAGRD